MKHVDIHAKAGDTRVIAYSQVQEEAVELSPGDFALILTGTLYQHKIIRHPNGTIQITLKRCDDEKQTRRWEDFNLLAYESLTP